MKKIFRRRIHEPRLDSSGFPINKFQVFLFVLCAINGFSLMLYVPISSALDGTLDNYQVRIYGSILFLGGVCVLLGMYWPKVRDGLLLKRIGYVSLAFATLIYGAAVIVFTGDSSGVLTGSTVLIFGLLCADQVWVINKRIDFLQDSGEQVDEE